VPDTSLGRRSIGEILLEHGHVTREQIDEAEALAADNGRPVGQILVESGAITRLELASALAEQWSDTGAPIAPPGSIGGTISTLDLPASPAADSDAPVPTPRAAAPAAADQSELVARLERVEEALDQLAQSAADGDAAAGLRAVVDDLTERLSAMEPVLEELGKGIEGLASDDRDTRLADQATLLDDLSQRVDAVAHSADSASRRTDELAEETAGAVESFRDGLATVTDRLPSFAAIEDLLSLTELVEAVSRKPARDEELVAELSDLRAVVDELARRPTGNPELVVQVDTLAGRLADVGDRVDVLAAAAQAAPGDPEAVEELREALAELARRPTADPESERRLEMLTAAVGEVQATVVELAARPAGNPELDERLFQLTARLEDLERAEALDEIRSRLAELAELAERPRVDPELADRLAAAERRLEEVAVDDVLERLDHDSHSLGYRIDGVIARLDELATTIEQQGESSVSREAWDEAVAVLNSRLEAEAAASARMAELEGRLAQVEGMGVESSAPGPDPELMATLEALQQRVAQVEATANAKTKAQKGGADPALGKELAALQQRVAQVEATATAKGPAQKGGGDPALGKQLAALAARVDQLAAEVAAAPRATAPPVEGDGDGAAAGPTSPTIERDVEHVLMAIERLSVHLGAHERALTELMGSGGLVAQVRELSARVSDIEAFGGGGGASGGGGGDGQVRAELRTLMRRLEEAEEAQRSDREKLIQQLEKAAGAIDWRLQRLESPTGDQPGS
jgi:hypothetical protein